MSIIANIIEALLNLMATKQRTFLALIGIIIGTGSVIAMVSIGKIVQNESLMRFKEMGTDHITISIMGSESARGLRLTDIANFAQTFESLERVAPIIQHSVRVKFGEKLERVRLIGVTEEFAKLQKLRFEAGRFVSPLDHHRRFCVVGYTIANNYAAAGQPLKIGSDIRLGDNICTVIGLLKKTSRGLSGIDTNRSVLLPITTMARIALDPNISEIVARVAAGTNHQRLSVAVTAWFRKHFRSISVDVMSPEQIIAQMEEQAMLFTLLLGAIGSISLVVGGVGVMNIMLMSVSERRKEIGIRRALGARRRDVQNQFLVEALILSVFGGLLGTGLGVGAAWLASLLNQWTFLFTPDAAALGLVVSIAVGGFFGFYPALQASRLDPITALRSG
ncbi:MAG: ABC transporter permease [Desulfobacteraceae bacterium]|nr:ABC transporter permease [Desulfobacteraceae bacterium]